MNRSVKKTLSLLTVLVFALGILVLPMNGYAATDNTVSKVLLVPEGYEFISTVTAPKLRIEEQDPLEFGTTRQIFRLKLHNAEWLSDYYFENSTFQEQMEGSCDDLKIRRLTDRIIEVTICNANPDRTSELSYEIPMLVQVGEGHQNPVTIEIESRDAMVTDGLYTFAVIK
ncbi:hypothetical protein [Inediibacterium massiliense]|uniref:hypothetical protein n=1 Tax=Inediibacterium massiliense TaxID=1658111 RepID=UPI0006B4DD71|nr:hypothetical protein [Inediibacterium massiliense]